MRSAISNDVAPPEPANGSDGPDPPAGADASAPPVPELNAAGARADSGGTFAPANVEAAGTAIGSAGVVSILGALKNGAGSQAFDVAGGAAPGDSTAGNGTGVVTCGLSVVAAGFAGSGLETEPKACAPTCSVLQSSRTMARVQAHARGFIGRRL
jgi:hypothetical protein